MKFLIDAQLPLRLAGWLKAHGHDALHTLDLPLGNRSSDSEITARATREDRIVITKDSDFVSSFLVTGNPPLLLIPLATSPTQCWRHFYSKISQQ